MSFLSGSGTQWAKAQDSEIAGELERREGSNVAGVTASHGAGTQWFFGGAAYNCRRDAEAAAMGEKGGSCAERMARGWS